jgi:hypothetical protein
MHLPPIGDTRDCALLKPAPNMGHSNRSCEQTQHTYLQGHLRGNFLPPQCPADKPLRGMTNISCTDRYNARGELGAAYHSTLCCGYARQSPVYVPNVVPSAPAYPRPLTFRSTYGIGANRARTTPCPQLGVIHRRDAISYVDMLRVNQPSMDAQCAKRGAPGGFSSVVYRSCEPSEAGLQFGLHTQADVTCAP